MGLSTPDVSQSSVSSSSSSVFFSGWYAFPFFRSIKKHYFNRFVFNMVQGHNLHLRSCSSLSCNFWQFGVKEAAAHHPIIQEEVNELLSNGTIEPSSGCAGYYSSVFVVSKHTGGLWPILNLKQFNHYLHIPYFKMPSITHIWQLNQHGDYAFFIDIQDAYLHIPIVKHHECLFTICLAQYAISIECFTFWADHSPQARVFTALTEPILFPCHCKDFQIVIYLDDILVLVCSKQAGKRAHSFLCSLLFHLELHINFSKSDLVSLRPLVSWGYVGILSVCQYLYLLKNS